MLKTDDNPDGVPQEVFDKMAEGMQEDRPAFMESFNKDFFGVSLINHSISEAFLADSLTKVMDSSPSNSAMCQIIFLYRLQAGCN